jgi:MFS family permease
VSTNSSRGVLWRHAGFMRLWSAQAISTFGARIARTGIPLAAVLVVHASPSALGVLAAMTTVPAVFVGIFSGGLVDRSRRLPLMIFADLVRAVVLLVIPVAAIFHLLSMVQLYLAGIVVGGASALFDIADHAYLPSLIGKTDLVEGNAKLAVTESVSEIGGPSLAGFLVQLLTAPIAIGVNALSYLGSAALLATIKDGEAGDGLGRRRNPWHLDVRSGLNAIFRNPLVKPLFLMAICSPVFEGFFGALYTIYAIDVLRLSPGLLGVIIGVGGVGALLGASLSPISCRLLGIGPTIVFCFVASAISAFFVPLAGGSVVMKSAMMMTAQLFGDSLAVAAMIPASSLRQTVLPGAVLGRTAAVFRAGAGASTVVGALAGGVLAESFGVRSTLFLAVCGILACTMIGVLSPLTKLKEIPEPAA